jgi:hypothetical protein
MQVKAQICSIFLRRHQSHTDMVEYVALPITLEHVLALPWALIVTGVGSRSGSGDRYRRDNRQPGLWPGSLFSVAVAVWRRNRDLLDNAGTLLGTTAVTVGLGFFYGALAARLFTQQEVGYGAAAVSAMTLLGTIGTFGLGSLLVGELPRRKDPGGSCWFYSRIPSASGHRPAQIVKGKGEDMVIGRVKLSGHQVAGESCLAST